MSKQPPVNVVTKIQRDTYNTPHTCNYYVFDLQRTRRQMNKAESRVRVWRIVPMRNGGEAPRRCVITSKNTK